MSKSIVTPIGRASFPSLAKLNQFGKYSITILLPKADPKVQEFVNWLGSAVKEEAMGVAGEAGFQAAMNEFTAFKDGDSPTAFKTYKPEFAGHWVMNCTRKGDFGRPSVVNRSKQPIDASEVYAGCNVLAYIDVFGYKFGTRKGVAIGFQHLMKTGENVRFASAGIEADQAFGDLDLPAEDPNAGVPAAPFGGGVVGGQPQPAPAPAQPAPVAPPQPVAPPVAPQQPSGNPFGGV